MDAIVRDRRWRMKWPLFRIRLNLAHRIAGLSVIRTLASTCLSCKERQAEKVSSPAEEKRVLETVSFNVLTANGESYLNKDVVVVGYLFTHEEGPWIGNDPKEPLFRLLGLEIKEGAKITSRDPAHFRNWYHYEKGFPALTTGILRRHPDADSANPNAKKFYLEVSSCREVDLSDPGWKHYRKSS